MSVLFIAVPVALLLVGSAVAAFSWAVRGGQLDDLETPALRVLNEERGSQPRTSSALGTSGRSDTFAPTSSR